MRWRFFRLNWSYGFAELVIIVTGVLIALAVDQWNTNRLSRLAEEEIIDRFIIDLGRDLEAIDSGLERISTKKAELVRVKSYMDSPQQRPDSPRRFLADVAGSARYGWNQARARRTTFDEVSTSGSFSLIRDTNVRVSISEYYYGDENRSRRIDERETLYSSLSYRLVPREEEFALAKNLSDEQIERLVDRVLASALSDEIIGEINVSQFLHDQFTLWRSLCVDLIEELETYRQTIESGG